MFLTPLHTISAVEQGAHIIITSLMTDQQIKGGLHLALVRYEHVELGEMIKAMLEKGGMSFSSETFFFSELIPLLLSLFITISPHFLPPLLCQSARQAKASVPVQTSQSLRNTGLSLSQGNKRPPA